MGHLWFRENHHLRVRSSGVQRVVLKKLRMKIYARVKVAVTRIFRVEKGRKGMQYRMGKKVGEKSLRDFTCSGYFFSLFFFSFFSSALPADFLLMLLMIQTIPKKKDLCIHVLHGACMAGA